MTRANKRDAHQAEETRQTEAATLRREISIDEYFQGVRGGDVTILARAITLMESTSSQHRSVAETLLTRLLPYTGQSIRVGITGAPGVGKSTFIESVGLRLIDKGRRVAVLAVDPSSQISGGSILGDKTRMSRLSMTPSAFIRPSASAGTLGGVARRSREGMLVCEAAGFDVVLIETVGVGQSETMVADMTDCFLALLLPGAGDELQGIKRGLLELVDVVAVNKADGASREAAEIAAAQYRLALTSLVGHRVDQAPEVLTCSALDGTGVDIVWDAIDQVYRQRKEKGELDRRRRQQYLHWLWSIVDDRLRHALQEHPGVQGIRPGLEQQVLAGVLPAEVAARQILQAFGWQE